NMPMKSRWRMRSRAGTNSSPERLQRNLAAQAGQKVLRVNRLGEDLKLVTLGTRLLKQISGCGLPGKEQNFYFGQQGSNLNGRVNAIQVSHNDVGDQHVRLVRGSHLKRGFAGINSAGLETALVQNHGQRISNDSFVVYNKDFGLNLVLGHTLLNG